MLNFNPPPPKKKKKNDSPRVPHCRFMLKIGKKSGKKSVFPIPTAKNRFQILNLHPKKHVFKKNKKKHGLKGKILPYIYIYIIYIYIYIYIPYESKKEGMKLIFFLVFPNIIVLRVRSEYW